MIATILAAVLCFCGCGTKTESNQNNPDSEFVCTLSVRCDTAVGKCPEKADVIPENGMIYPEKQVSFSEGESVFDILKREMTKEKIHLEFSENPMYKTAYIEGISNLYEFDCGELSGWMYRVNGEFPNVGCSSYFVKSGDKIEFLYSCDMGKDIGKDDADKDS